MNKNRFWFSIFCLGIVVGVYAQDGEVDNWYFQTQSKDQPQNINVDYAFKSLLKNRVSQPIVVAVIDSGVDVEHEDLRESIWNNTNEIPDNNIDDDQNGYIDDIYGWNFIGGKNGTQVDADTYEMTRLYGELRKKYNDIDPSTLNKSEQAEYNKFIKWGKKIENEVKNSKKNYEQYFEQYSFYKDLVDHVESIEENTEIDDSVLDSLEESFNQLDVITANMFKMIKDQTGSYPTIESLQTDLLEQIYEGVKHYEDKWKYNYNPDYDPRAIVGDNYADKTERYYGNNLVEGPDALHGTHVSGIIAATQDNNIGMKGIAKNTKIMVLRAVPNGDERDKDIANAIYYAVDNGASIINMSFGKGQSPEKEIVDDAIRYAAKKDVLIVHAAGNSNEELSPNSNFPNDHYIKPKGFLFWKTKKPKNYITVGASGPTNDERLAASFSNYSKTEVDVFAPGVQIYSTVPDNQYRDLQGTSMAAPVISGVAAVIRSYFPTLTAEQVKNIIINSTSPLSNKVYQPGTEELVPFSSLSVSGGIVDLKAAIVKAAQIIGAKKINSKKKQSRA